MVIDQGRVPRLLVRKIARAYSSGDAIYVEGRSIAESHFRFRAWLGWHCGVEQQEMFGCWRGRTMFHGATL